MDLEYSFSHQSLKFVLGSLNEGPLLSFRALKSGLSPLHPDLAIKPTSGPTWNQTPMVVAGRIRVNGSYADLRATVRKGIVHRTHSGPAGNPRKSIMHCVSEEWYGDRRTDGASNVTPQS